MKKLFCQSVFLAFVIAGCAMGPLYQQDEIEIPCQWSSEVSSCLNCDSPEGVIWWKCLDDPTLNELMAYAAAQNLDLKIAAVRVLQARCEANAKKADLYPHVDGSASYGHFYGSKNALVDGLLGLSVSHDHVRRNVNYYEVGFDADWELDFFGFTAHEIAALKAHEEALQESLCGVWVTLSAEIAKNYIELRGLQKRLEIACENIEAETEVLNLTKELLERGIVSESDYSKVYAELSALYGEIPLIELNISYAIHRLSILLGYPPGELCQCLSKDTAMPEVPCDISVGIPSELLRRRPDIRNAERELEAATQRVGTAVASLFPRFSLQGFLGEISTHAGSLFSPGSATWLAGPQVLVPLFNSRLILQSVEYNKLETQAAFLTYQKTVLSALEEAENAIASFHNQEERFCNLQEAFDNSETHFIFEETLYDRGINDNFAVMNAKKTLVSAEEAMIQSKIDLLLSYVSLYKAIGGSWDEKCASVKIAN